MRNRGAGVERDLGRLSRRARRGAYVRVGHRAGVATCRYLGGMSQGCAAAV